MSIGHGRHSRIAAFPGKHIVFWPCILRCLNNGDKRGLHPFHEGRVVGVFPFRVSLNIDVKLLDCNRFPAVYGTDGSRLANFIWGNKGLDTSRIHLLAVIVSTGKLVSVGNAIVSIVSLRTNTGYGVNYVREEDRLIGISFHLAGEQGAGDSCSLIIVNSRSLRIRY